MVLTLRLFASYAEAFGADTLTLDLPDQATVDDLLAAVRRRPEAALVPPSPLVAVNLAYARPGTVLRDGDEVALIPPVAGG